MALFLLFATATIGLTNIIVDSSVFAPLRAWAREHCPKKVNELLNCHQCMGLWCGLFCGLVILHCSWLYWLLYACAGSFLATISIVLYEYLLSKTEFEFPPAETYSEDQENNETEKS